MPAFGLSDAAVHITITATIAMSSTLVTLAMRILLRLRVNGPFGWDDYACMVSSVSKVKTPEK